MLTCLARVTDAGAALKEIMRPIRISTWILAALGVCGVAHAGLLDVSFYGTGFISTPPPSGAAVLGAPGDVWNPVGIGNPNVPTDFGPLGLVDTTGTPITTQLSFNAEGGVICGSCLPQPDPDLMTNYIYNHDGGPITVDLTGLVPLANYTLVLYVSSGDARSGSRILTVSVNGTPAGSASGDPLPAFTPGSNYVQLSVTADATGSLSIVEGNPGNADNEVDMNGLQLQGTLTETPEPAPWLLIPGGALALLAGKAKRKK